MREVILGHRPATGLCFGEAGSDLTIFNTGENKDFGFQMVFQFDANERVFTVRDV